MQSRHGYWLCAGGTITTTQSNPTELDAYRAAEITALVEAAGAAVGLPEFAANLLAVCVGNVVGGARGVASAYRLACGPQG